MCANLSTFEQRIRKREKERRKERKQTAISDYLGERGGSLPRVNSSSCRGTEARERERERDEDDHREQRVAPAGGRVESG